VCNSGRAGNCCRRRAEQPRWTRDQTRAVLDPRPNARARHFGIMPNVFIATLNKNNQELPSTSSTCGSASCCAESAEDFSTNVKPSNSSDLTPKADPPPDVSTETSCLTQGGGGEEGRVGGGEGGEGSAAMKKAAHHFKCLGVEHRAVVVAVNDRDPLGLHGNFTAKYSVEINALEIRVRLGDMVRWMMQESNGTGDRAATCMSRPPLLDAPKRLLGSLCSN
jgi:hypothetical protein